ncbi:P-loop NTPase [Ruminococcus sp.]
MKKITIITGHYGSGKTNLAVNLALRLADAGEKVTIVDFDIVNPYFRTADFAELFQKHGVTLAASMYANTSLDIPAISFDMERMAYEPGYLIVDVGGDDAGAIGLGRYAEGFSAYVPEQLDMWYVINRYRYLTERPEETLELMYEIEAVSRMRHTGIVNNSNLGRETTADTIQQALPYAEETAAQAKLPLVYTTYRNDLELSLPNGLPVDVFVKPVWEE